MYIGFYLYDPRLDAEEAFKNEFYVIIAVFTILGGLNLYAHHEYSVIANENLVREDDESN